MPSEIPVNHGLGKRPGRPARRQRRTRRSGLSDFAIGTARTVAATTLLSMLINAGPFLFTILAGAFFLLRGCAFSGIPAVAPHPSREIPRSSPRQIASSRIPSGGFSPTEVTQARAARAQRGTTSQQVVSSTIESPSELGAAHFDESLHYDQSAPQSGNVQFLEHHQEIEIQPFAVPATGTFTHPMLPGSFPAGNLLQPLLDPDPAVRSPFSFGMPPNTMLQAIADPTSDSPTMAMETSPLFSFQRGRNFEGTSQMPGQPSRRIRLAVEGIRERGKNISARITALDGPHVTKKFVGSIEYNPLRLSLSPERHPTSFGIVLPYEPWYSNSMASISLYVSPDGKAIQGTSTSNEEYELLPQFDIAPPVENPSVEEFTDVAGVFDAERSGSTRWKLVKRNGESLDDDSAQVWTFTNVHEGSGNFGWTKGDRSIASGSYFENGEPGQLDIQLASGSSPAIYRCRFLQDTTQSTIRVCVPAQATANRPTKVSTDNGNVFEMVLLESSSVRR